MARRLTQRARGVWRMDGSRGARPASAVERTADDWRRVATALALGAGLSLCTCTYAQALTDPTRPPIDIYADPDASAQVGAPTAFTLQSVMITPTRRTAIISGERVTLGGTYAGSRVVRITESEVVLRSSYGTETLRMYPAVAMKPARQESVKKKAIRKSGPADTNVRGSRE
jgi:MSHA biogenesis protein MshK